MRSKAHNMAFANNLADKAAALAAAGRPLGPSPARFAEVFDGRLTSQFRPFAGVSVRHRCGGVCSLLSTGLFHNLDGSRGRHRLAFS